jgi:hypothetical protein
MTEELPVEPNCSVSLDYILLCMEYLESLTASVVWWSEFLAAEVPG